MKKILLCLLALAACAGPQGERGSTGNQGATGSKGSQGAAGINGINCETAVIEPGDMLPYGGAVIACVNGWVLISNGVPGENGQDGAAGTDGMDGTNGTNGVNGLDGQNGQDAQPSMYDIVAVINPCGDASEINDEVFLKLANGQTLWLQVDNASGQNARLALSTPGTYRTTDGDSCTFTIDANGVISNESHIS